MKLGEIAAAFGKGVFAGVAGTNALHEIAQVSMIQTPDEETVRTRDASKDGTSHPTARTTDKRDVLPAWKRERA